MASTSGSAAISGRARTAGSGIALGGDRTASRRIAMRHSRIVRTLKIAFPFLSVAVIGLYSLTILQTTGWGTGIPELVLPTIIPENIAMENPHYDGFNKDGGKYWFTAKTAQQDLKILSHIKLNAITGELTDAQKAKTHLVATRGMLDNKTNILELYDSIDVVGDNGLKSHLTRATIQTKENIITSNEPVVVMMEAGTVNSNRMTIRQKTKEYTFVDKVRTFLKARTPPPSPTDPETGIAAAKKAQTFGNSNEPIDIVSNRLDVNDLQKTALFTGNVKAVQATSSLSTPEMLVTYEGSATAQGQPSPTGQAADGGKVKRVLAKDPVVLTQADGQTVNSRSADFDTISQKAVLEGDVVMVQLPDKRAVGDRADVDQIADTVLLTGDVVVTQGQNTMKGRRLYYERKTSKMQLTSPSSVDAGAAGRVNAHFQQDATTAAPAAGENVQKPDMQQGFAFGGSFKTDPKAPYDVESDRLDVDDARKQALFTGNVRAVQGDFVVRSSELTAYYTGSAGLGANQTAAASANKQEAAHLTRLQARKNVVVTSKDGQNATGDWADFDTKVNTVTLGGNVIMTQGKNVVRGTKLVIDMTTGESVIRTEPDTSRGGPMTSSSDGTGNGVIINNGMIIKSGRPSAVFYPNMLKGAASAVKDAAQKSGAEWDTKTEASKAP